MVRTPGQGRVRLRFRAPNGCLWVRTWRLPLFLKMLSTFSWTFSHDLLTRHWRIITIAIHSNRGTLMDIPAMVHSRLVHSLSPSVQSSLILFKLLYNLIMTFVTRKKFAQTMRPLMVLPQSGFTIATHGNSIITLAINSRRTLMNVPAMSHSRPVHSVSPSVQLTLLLYNLIKFSAAAKIDVKRMTPLMVPWQSFFMAH